MSSPSGSGRLSFVLGLLRDWGIALAVVFVVLALWNTFSGSAPRTGEPAPPFTLPDLAGGEVSLADVQADTVVLNFWFTSCPPCRAEIPELSAWHAEHPEVPLYGVSTDRGMPTGRLRALSERLGITYPVLHDSDLAVARAYGVSVFPTTVVLHDGQVAAVKVGTVNRRSLSELVASVE